MQEIIEERFMASGHGQRKMIWTIGEKENKSGGEKDERQDKKKR